MTLLLIIRKVWHYRLVTVPILALVLVGAVYMVAIKKPVYTTTASYILVNPPAPPTPDQIARNPKLRSGSSNPYTRFSDPSIVVQVLAARLGSDQARQALAAEGADPNYIVAPDVSFGFTAPIVLITGTGATPAGAVETANIVGRELTRLLNRMQSTQGVSPTYRITSQLLVGARQATLKTSGKLRGLVAVLALGGVLLFLVVSVLDAVAILRQRDGAREVDGQAVPSEELADGDFARPRSPSGPPEPMVHVEPPIVLTPEGRSARRLWPASRYGAGDGP